MRRLLGFTLIEITITLAVIGLLSMGLLQMLAVQNDYQRIKHTERAIDEIIEALYGYTIIYERLPCADSDFDGVQDCPSSFGKLPWKDLGFGRYDAWGRQFHYAVDASLISTPLSSSLEMDDFSVGIGLNDPKPIFIPAIIWSEGKTFHEAPRSDCEVENADSDNQFAICDFIENKYDDILGWPNWNTILLRLVAAGKWPP